VHGFEWQIELSLRHDGPEDDRFAMKLKISLPSTVETFVRSVRPRASASSCAMTAARSSRIEDGSPLPMAADRVVPLD